jgi:hypothetical protein
VLYSDIVDALARHPDSVNFYIGHELGHIDRKHLNWALPLWPASLLPVLGYAYSRAREYTCDRYGIFCCERKGDAMFALAVLASGTERWRKIDMKEFVAQSKETGAFWMSFHEFTAGYPWLCKRMSWLRAIVAKQEPEFPRRNFISFLLSLFVPSIGISRSGGGIVNLMVVVAVIGILSAVALPAYQDYITTANRAKVLPAFDYREQISEAMNPYIIDNSELPFTLEQIGLSSHPPVTVIETLAIVESRIVLTLTTRFSGEEDTIVLIPYVEDGDLFWSCSEGTLDEKYRPEECRQ